LRSPIPTIAIPTIVQNVIFPKDDIYTLPDYDKTTDPQGSDFYTDSVWTDTSYLTNGCQVTTTYMMGTTSFPATTFGTWGSQRTSTKTLGTVYTCNGASYGYNGLRYYYGGENQNVIPKNDGHSVLILDAGGDLQDQMMEGSVIAYNVNEPGVGVTGKEKAWIIVEGVTYAGETVRYRSVVAVSSSLDGRGINHAEHEKMRISIEGLGLMNWKILASGHTHPPDGPYVSEADVIFATNATKINPYPTFMMFPNNDMGRHELYVVIPDSKVKGEQFLWSGKNHQELVRYTPIPSR
jgi:hypothetical protein